MHSQRRQATVSLVAACYITDQRRQITASNSLVPSCNITYQRRQAKALNSLASHNITYQRRQAKALIRWYHITSHINVVKLKR